MYVSYITTKHITVQLMHIDLCMPNKQYHIKLVSFPFIGIIGFKREIFSFL